jgi:hypothetical protein
MNMMNDGDEWLDPLIYPGFKRIMKRGQKEEKILNKKEMMT